MPLYEEWWFWVLAGAAIVGVVVVEPAHRRWAARARESVVASPWIWGYADVDGAIACDTVTGGIVALLSTASVLFPALLALNLLAGLWLVTAPWLVGFGTEGGAVGVSDVCAGLAICALALRGLTEAGRRLNAAQSSPIGRVRR
jgi:hypothetical protein